MLALWIAGFTSLNIHMIAMGGHLTVFYTFVRMCKEAWFSTLTAWKKTFGWITVAIVLFSIETLFLLLEFFSAYSAR